MNKTTTILLVLFLLLGAGAWWFSQQNETKKSTLTVENDFYMAVDDLEEVHKVFFANRNGETVEIARKDKHWIYNDKYIARKNAVDNVLDVVKRVRLKYRPPKTAVSGAIKYMASSGIKVEVYDKNDKNLQTYYIGGATPDERGTYMMLDGAENPYVMHLPVWEGNLRTRFFFGDHNWRDKTVLQENAETIKMVSVNYPERKDESFILELQNGTYDLKPFYDDNKSALSPDQNKILEYLGMYKRVGAEGFENDNEKVTALCMGTPFCELSLVNTKDKKTTIRIFPLLQKDEKGVPYPDQKVERLIAHSSTGDYFLIQQIIFGKLFRTYESFLNKTTQN